MHFTVRTIAAAAIALIAQSDPSRHQVRFVAVEPDVTLELIDWGGSGQAVVLLAGSGNSGHVFDDFAPKLLDCCHVYAITRRGYGASSRPVDENRYGWQRLADDVFQVIDQGHIPKPVLIGHSMSGGEMTAVGHEHSDRLAGIVYLDALGDLEDDPPADKEWAALQAALPPGLHPSPTCPPLDRSTFAAYRRTLGCELGFMFPESELRNTFDENRDGSVGEVRVPGWVSRAIGQRQIFRRDYSNIHVPVLALNNGFAPDATTDDVLKTFRYEVKTPEERAAIDRFMARSNIVFGRWITKLKTGAPDARIVYYPNAGHFVWMTRQAEVLREIHTFIAALR
jgi:pimeloyl-ACP methyl ester carboxylesterase